MSSFTPIKTPEQIKSAKPFFHTPFFTAPSKTLFVDRALRFEELASTDSSDWGACLQRLGNLCHAQQEVLETGEFELPEGFTSNFILPAADGQFVPESFYQTLQQFLNYLEQKIPSNTFEQLKNLSQQEVEVLTKGVLQNQVSVEQEPLSPWIHGVAQIIWTAWAMQLQEDDVPETEDRGFCPCCGTEAVASMILIRSDLHNLRYMHCPNCNSRWNALRAKCTFCGDQSSMSLLGIENAKIPALKGARAECCDTCHSYRKMFLLQHQQYADPVADDLASLAVDILTGEDGYQRGGCNPFFLTKE